MTRRKDKIREKKNAVQKNRDLGKSRLFLQQDGIKKEIQLLEMIIKLPNELIRIIFSYMSGNAKLLCNYKFDYLDKYKYKYFDFHLSKSELLNMIHKGCLRKYPDLIEKCVEYYFCEDIQQFAEVKGLRLIHLWETNKLLVSYDGTFPNTEENILKINQSILHSIQDAIYNYIKNVISLYQDAKIKVFTKKNGTLPGNTLFLDLDRVFYLYKSLENLQNKYYQNTRPLPLLFDHSIPLIPTPLLTPLHF
jgi:hypothetical protein